MRSLLATILTNLFLVVGSIVFALGAILGAAIPPRGVWSFRSARAWARGLLWCAGVRLEIERQSALPPEERYVFVSNHQSLFDIPVLLVSVPGSTRFLAKRSLFHIPVFGWAMRVSGFVPVDREDRSRAKEAMDGALRQLQQGRSILLFPEETRSLDGRIREFQRGGFLIALKAKCPLVPVGLSGTRRIQRKGSLLVRPGAVRVRYGTPVDPSLGGVRARRELVETMRAEVVRLSGEPPVGDDQAGTQEQDSTQQ
ncbi:MAG TPA: lysophospholipid acyltransferase family protein [Thermoanaerobaculia bacterium]|nr:lysophospholipid acyltransferase family protein [Thermoanaerobaculia bacterium]